jgi:hypothetical protein
VLPEAAGTGHPASELAQTPSGGLFVYTYLHTILVDLINMLQYKEGFMGITNFFSSISFGSWMEIGIGLFALISGFMVGWKRKGCNIKKKKQKANKETNWFIHSQIHELLTELRFSTDAARAQLAQFHNGEYFMDGVSMRKMSLTHESLAKGVSADSDRLQGMLISLFSPLIGKVLEDEAHLHLTKDDKDCYFKNFLVSGSIVSYMVLPVRCENSVCGFLMLQWGSPAKTKLTQKNMSIVVEKMEETRNQIQIQLDEQLRTVH